MVDELITVESGDIDDFKTLVNVELANGADLITIVKGHATFMAFLTNAIAEPEA